MLVNGVNLNVKVVGSGPAIVALHGFTGDMSTWSEFVPEAEKKCTVITIDLLGHWNSDAPRAPQRYRIEQTLDDIASVVHELGFSQACWLGYSMGGRIALAAAAMIPNVCHCLVLEGASPGLRSTKARVLRQRKDEALADFILKEGVAAFVDSWTEKPLFRSQKSLPTYVQERIRKQRLRNNPIGLANTLRVAGSGTQPSIHEMLPRISIPVLCIAGEYDHKFTTIARKICNKLQNGRLEIMPGAGHATHLERPRDFNRVVLDFLNESLNWSVASSDIGSRNRYRIV